MNLDIKRVGNNYMIFFTGYRLIFSGIRVKGKDIQSNLKIVDTDTEKTLFISTVELMDIDARWKLSRHLEILERNVRWQELLTLAFTKVINELLTHDEPAQLIETEPHEHYFIKPIVADPYTLIFAPGGSGKSYLALLIAMAVQNGLDFGFFEMQATKMNVLYLDWETSLEDISRRFTLLKNGLGQDLESPYYRNLALPLNYEFDKVLDDIVKYNIKLLIIDSVVPAIGGNINHADVVGEFFSMLKQFYNTNGTRTLLLTHISKQSKKEEGDKSPIGSVYFENYPRLVWELKSVSLRDKLQIDLIPYKFNISKPSNLSFLFKFRYNGVDVLTSENIEETDEVKEFIKQVVEQENEIKIKDLILKVKQQFGLHENSIRRKIEELKRAGTLSSAGYGVVSVANNLNENDEPPF